MTEATTLETIQPPELDIQAVSWPDIPPLAEEWFMTYRSAAQVRGREGVRGDFAHLFKVAVAGDIETVTYAAAELLTPTGPDEVSMLIQTVDTTGDGTEQKGFGVIQYFSSSLTPKDNRAVPIQNWSGTEPKYLNQGLARRRIFVMDGLARAECGKPLDSGASFRTFGRAPWLRLVEQGLAERYVDANGLARYRML